MTRPVCAFDAYGTLFDVSAAARELAASADHPKLAERWQSLAANWRLKQLQYSWLRAVAGAHCDFWQVTCDGLDWALEAEGLGADDALRSALLDLYWKLSAYPEVPEVLTALRESGHPCAILSNGSPDMLAGAVAAAGIGDLLDAVLSVEDVGVFKPHRSVYQLVADRFDCEPADVLFGSSNGWDAAAAAGFGFATVWVNRAREPVERLPWRPIHALADLRGFPDLAKAAA